MYEFDETRPADPGWRQTHPPVPPGHHVMYLAAAGNSAGYVVVGRTYAGNPGPTFHDDRSWLWYSHDGRSWQRYAQSEIGTFGQDLLATGDRFYSPGSTADGSPAVWSSADGLHWKPAVVEAPSSPPLPSETASVWVSRLSCDDDQLIATGAEHGRPLIWTSPDGTHWTRRDWADPEVSALTLRRWPGINAYGPAGTVAMAPRGDGWAPHSVWFHAPLHP